MSSQTIHVYKAKHEVIDPATGETIVEVGQVIDDEVMRRLSACGFLSCPHCQGIQYVSELLAAYACERCGQSVFVMRGKK